MVSKATGYYKLLITRANFRTILKREQYQGLNKLQLKMEWYDIDGAIGFFKYNYRAVFEV